MTEATAGTAAGASEERGGGGARPLRVLAFGDSNTWGFRAADGARFDERTRWTGRLAASLGPGWAVVEEGLNGRTTVFDDPVAPGRRGLDYLPPCLASHAPLDAVIAMLGTNDLKARFSATPGVIAAGMRRVAEVVLASGAGRGGGAPALLLVAPPPLHPEVAYDDLVGRVEASRGLAAAYRAVAAELGCAFLDAGGACAFPPVDGLHLGPDGHADLARAVEAALRDLLWRAGSS